MALPSRSVIRCGVAGKLSLTSDASRCGGGRCFIHFENALIWLAEIDPVWPADIHATALISQAKSTASAVSDATAVCLRIACRRRKSLESVGRRPFQSGVGLGGDCLTEKTCQTSWIASRHFGLLQFQPFSRYNPCPSASARLACKFPKISAFSIAVSVFSVSLTLHCGALGCCEPHEYAGFVTPIMS